MPATQALYKSLQSVTCQHGCPPHTATHRIGPRFTGVDPCRRQLDPEAYAWVHMTTYYTMITTQQTFGKRPFTPAEAEQLYLEWVQQGRVLGIRDQDMPQDQAAFWQYFDNMVVQRLENTDTARYLLDVSLREVTRPPQLGWMPHWLWNLIYSQLGKNARLATAATLPEYLRKTLDVDWNDRLARRYARRRTLVRLLLPLIPAKVRYLPPAYLALTGQMHRLHPARDKAAARM